jgi:hypothetical protein
MNNINGRKYNVDLPSIFRAEIVLGAFAVPICERQMLVVGLIRSEGAMYWLKAVDCFSSWQMALSNLTERHDRVQLVTSRHLQSHAELEHIEITTRYHVNDLLTECLRAALPRLRMDLSTARQ